jgi:hypothetical protein
MHNIHKLTNIFGYLGSLGGKWLWNWFPRVYRKFGTSLETAPATQASFKPTTAGQWKSDTINLSAFAGSFVNIKFRGINRICKQSYILKI